MPVPAIGLKKPLPKEWLMPNIILVFYITKAMVCRKTMSVPATGLRKLPLKGTAPPNLHCACCNGKGTSLPRQAT